MNESMSILLATTILALGGFGLYMYKSSDNGNETDKNEYYDEGNLFDGNFWGFKDDDEEQEDDKGHEDKDYNDETEEYVKPRRRTTHKTHKNKRSSGTSKRRYY